MKPPDMHHAGHPFRPDEAFAQQMDAGDPLAPMRSRFCIPDGPDGRPAIYVCANSLGLMPRSARQAVDQVLEQWGELAVRGHFEGPQPWYTYIDGLKPAMARMVGAAPHEVTLMNGLTVNLHLMMATFYRPTRQRWRILVEDCTFPTDTYALRTQLRHHGFDPDTGLIVVRPRPGEDAVREEDIEARLDREGESIAVVMLGGVNYFTGQVFDMRRVAAAARRRGCVVGYDLAHAAGNVELSLHAWEVDFAVWCTYKYVNGGPGCVAGCFVHERHARDTGLARLGGWWGNDPARRFLMHLEPQFKPVASADGWQVSNPPLLSLAALKASLEIFDEIGMAALREKSVRLTGYLLHRLDGVGGQFEVITPREPERRGCQVSLRIRERAREVFQRLLDAGVVGDFREPDVIRLAPAPLYNTFHEVWRLGQIMKSVFA